MRESKEYIVVQHFHETFNDQSTFLLDAIVRAGSCAYDSIGLLFWAVRTKPAGVADAAAEISLETQPPADLVFCCV